MSLLPSQDDLLQRKAREHAEIARHRQRREDEERGLAEACARYWELLEEFVVRAGEIGVEPRRHQSVSHKGSTSPIEWVEGYRLRSGAIVAAPPLRYCLRERRRIVRPRAKVREVEAVMLFVVTTDPGLAAGLSEPKTESAGGWPAVERWDRAVSLLFALEAELEASLLELMDTKTGSASQFRA
jgi:hypothetical protein